MLKIIKNLRTAPRIDRDRAASYLKILCIGKILAFLYFYLELNGFIGRGIEPGASIDFLSFYSAGHLADAGTAERVYQSALLYTAEQQISADDHITYFGLFYPPTFLLICGLLARLPYVGAYLGWVISTGGPLSAVASLDSVATVAPAAGGGPSGRGRGARLGPEFLSDDGPVRPGHGAACWKGAPPWPAPCSARSATSRILARRSP